MLVQSCSGSLDTIAAGHSFIQVTPFSHALIRRTRTQRRNTHKCSGVTILWSKSLFKYAVTSPQPNPGSVCKYIVTTIYGYTELGTRRKDTEIHTGPVVHHIPVLRW